jgi:hypothetical protein
VSFGRSCQVPFWFDVDKNLCYLWQCPENFVFDLVRQSVSFADAYFAMHNNVEVDVVGESHFTNEAFVQAKNAADLSGDFSHLRFQSRVRGDVAKFKDRRSQLFPTVIKNYQCSTERCPAIGCLPPRSTQDGDGNANESKRRREGISSVMPGVSFDREASGGLAYGVNVSEQQFLDDQYSRKHDKGVGCWCGVRRGYFTNAFIDNAACRRH